jgi:phospholipid-transporting ATPase
MRGTVEMEHPNKLIDSFAGVVDLGPEIGRVAVQVSNVLLRGTVLRNTDWIIGIVINTGHDTKIMMSNTVTKPKTSFLETATSREIRRIIILLAIVCFTGATGEAIFNHIKSVKQSWYIAWPVDPVSFWFVQFFYFFLLHATFIPVSLYVSMSVVRSFQSYFMNNDLEMYYATTDRPALVRTMTLNEELGQISHIFTDKTGTLTCNIMDFRKASINGVSYGVGITEIGKAAWKLQGKTVPEEVLAGEARAKELSVPHVSFYCSTYDRDFQEGGIQKHKIQQFFKTIAICHDVIPEKVDDVIHFSASNPDDEALVCAAEYFGFQFVGRGEGKVVIMNRERGVEEVVEVLETIAFTSKRKRMSVIIRDTDKVIRLLCKGADTSLSRRLAVNQEDLLGRTDGDIERYCLEGLRCLMVGHAEISEEVYTQWSVRYAKACTNMEEIEKRRKGEDNDIESLQDDIEQDLILLGATALEDRYDCVLYCAVLHYSVLGQLNCAVYSITCRANAMTHNDLLPA